MQEISAGEDDLYPPQLIEPLRDKIGVLYIEWGGGPSGKRAWVQRAESQDKEIVGLYPKEATDGFPGFGNFIKPVSDILRLPLPWREELARVKGVYLLTCPRTREHYVGSARGGDSFLGCRSYSIFTRRFDRTGMTALIFRSARSARMASAS